MYKPHIYIIIALCVLCIGFGAYGYYSGRKAGELDREIGELRELVTRNRRAGEQLQDNYQKSQAENDRLRQEILDGFADAHDGISNIEQGLQAIGDGLGGVLQEMYAYAEKNNPPD